MIGYRQQILVGLMTVAFVLAYWHVPFAETKGEEGSNVHQRFALNFNEAMNRCLQTGCKNIEELMGFFWDESSFMDDSGNLWNGKAS